jgi:hypothetical protein
VAVGDLEGLSAKSTEERVIVGGMRAAIHAQTLAALCGSSATALGDDLEPLVERIEPS